MGVPHLQFHVLFSCLQPLDGTLQGGSHVASQQTRISGRWLVISRSLYKHRTSMNSYSQALWRMGESATTVDSGTGEYCH